MISTFLPRRAIRTACGPLALLLFALVWVGGQHHHSQLRAHDACPTCTVAHTLAIAVPRATLAQRPTIDPEFLEIDPCPETGRRLTVATQTRAPPGLRIVL